MTVKIIAAATNPFIKKKLVFTFFFYQRGSGVHNYSVGYIYIILPLRVLKFLSQILKILFQIWNVSEVFPYFITFMIFILKIMSQKEKIIKYQIEGEFIFGLPTSVVT